MRKTKYMMSEGLAFSEGKDMEKLRQQSLNGWHVSSFKFMGYSLQKGESQDYIYSLDYRSLDDGEKREYFEFFSSAGWSHIASEGDMHLFRAKPNTKPIYSDSETKVEKYGHLTSSLIPFAIPFLSLTALSWLGTMFASGTFQTILQVTAIVLTVIAIPTAMTVLAAYSNKWKANGKTGLVKFSKLLPALLFLAALATLLFYADNNRITLLAAMIIGALGFPAAIWLLMTLFQKTRGRKA